MSRSINFSNGGWAMQNDAALHSLNSLQRPPSSTRKICVRTTSLVSRPGVFGAALGGFCGATRWLAGVGGFSGKFDEGDARIGAIAVAIGAERRVAVE